MEGVVVAPAAMARPSQIQRRYRCAGALRLPGRQLDPSRYALAIRAIGFELDGAEPPEIVPNKTAHADLKLKRR